MSKKLNNTPIKPYAHIHLTNKAYAIAAGLALWTTLTTGLTVVAVNSKYFHNEYQCEATEILPPNVKSTPKTNESKVISRISNLYDIPVHKIYEVVGIVNSYTSTHTFPDAKTTLAIIATESSFQKNATSSANAKGYMQILHTSGKPVTYEPWQNIKSGTELLREYYQQLGSADAAIQAYNIGIGSYLKGKRAPDYLNSVNKHKRMFDNV